MKEGHLITKQSTGDIYIDGTASSVIPTCIEITKQPIGDICVAGMVFDPQLDITPLESIRLTVLFMREGFYDYGGYIKKHKLDRHFRKDTLK